MTQTEGGKLVQERVRPAGTGGGRGVNRPTIISSLSNCVEVACGTAVSYAWGMGTNGQLGTGDEVRQNM